MSTIQQSSEAQFSGTFRKSLSAPPSHPQTRGMHTRPREASTFQSGAHLPKCCLCSSAEMLMGGLGASVWEPLRLGEPPLPARPGFGGAAGWDSTLHGTGNSGILGVNSTDTHRLRPLGAGLRPEPDPSLCSWLQQGRAGPLGVGMAS